MALTQGYFLIALGKHYIDECEKLVQTIRKQGDTRPVALLIHPEDESYAAEKNLFDKFISFVANDDLFKDCQTSFEKFCLYPRLKFEQYLPYDENIIVDSDVLCQYSPDSLWNHFSNQPFPIRMLGRKDDAAWHWGSIGEVSKAYGQHVPHVHGGFFYIRKDGFLKSFFDYCRIVFYRYDEYKCRRAFRGGKVDEIIFAIAHSYFNINPVEFDSIPAMTFNYTPDISIPSKLQTEGGQNKELDGYIPFVHMFDKLGGANFEALYNKIMNGN